MADIARTGRNGERDELFILTLFPMLPTRLEAINLSPKSKLMIEDNLVLAIIGKGNKPRLVAITEKLSYHLGDYAGRDEITGDARYFPFTRFRGLQIIQEIGQKAGISRRLYCHLLRHGGAVTRLSKTGNPKSLQVYLGHNDFKMTMRYLSTLQAIESIKTESKVEFAR